MKKYALTALLVLGLPFATQAITADELRQQVSALLSQLTQLQQQIVQLQTNPTLTATSTTIYSTTQASVPTTVPTTVTSVVCPVFNFTLSRGSRGEAVTALQRFLVSQGYLSTDSITGYYGPLTESSVQRLQAQQGIVSSGSAESTGWGVVGKQTSASIARLCTGSTSQPTQVTPSTTSCSPLFPPNTACSSGWQAVADTRGCVASYQCVIELPPATPTLTCPSGYVVSGTQCVSQTITTSHEASITVSAKGDAVVAGGSIAFAWDSQYAPSGSVVQLELVDASTNEIVGDGFTCSAAGISGFCAWTVPALLDTKATGYSCGRWTDRPGICGGDLVSGHLYKIRAALRSDYICRGFCIQNESSVKTYATAYSSSFPILSAESTKICPALPIVDCAPGSTYVDGGYDATGCRLKGMCVQ